ETQRCSSPVSICSRGTEISSS
ncbi:hypothetical protein AVDCRST_MAG94-2630, partial [uncultured Leptolyngbya sp.]